MIHSLLPPADKNSPSLKVGGRPAKPNEKWAIAYAVLSMLSHRAILRGSVIVLLCTTTVCTPDRSSSPVVTICATTGSPEACAGDQQTFVTGQRLSAYLVSDQPFAAQQVIGKILRLADTDTIPLGTRMISLEENQRSVVQDLPFHEFGQQAAGTFLIEFVDQDNQLIAKKEITITKK